jgi:hypothetical protein
VSCVVERSSCRSIMLRHGELAFLKAMSTRQLSHHSKGAVAGYVATEEEASGARREPQHHIWRWGQSPQRSSDQLAGKRKANELASSGNSSVPANRRPAPGAGSAPLPANSTVTGEQPAVGSWQLVSPEGGERYAAALAGSVAPFQPSGSLKPTAMGSELSEPAVSSDTANRRMSEDMSGPLSDKPDGTTPNAQVTNTCLPAGERPNKTPIFIAGASDTHSSLAWLREFCPGGLTAQLKGEKLMVAPATAGFQAVISALRSLDGREGVSFHTFTLPEDRCVRLLVKNLCRVCLRASSGRSWNP